MTYPRINILGVPVDCLTTQEARKIVCKALETPGPQSIIAVNPEKVMQARRNHEVLAQLMRTSVLIPDGIGVVWLARRKVGHFVQRVAGADFMPEICKMAQVSGAKIFLFGGEEGIAERVAQHLDTHFPGIQIVGTQHGYLPESEMDILLERITALGTHILFLALGSPKQECWMAQYLPRLQVRLCQGVGGTFDVLAGKVRRAPAVVQACHGEWLYRLMMNPSRFFRQQALWTYMVLVVKQYLLGVRS